VSEFGLGGADKTPPEKIGTGSEPARTKPEESASGEVPVPFLFGRGEAEPQSPPPIDASLWEDVLQHTAEVDALGPPLTSSEQEALCDVARRYQGCPLTLQPVAAALVQAVVMPQCPTGQNAAEFWQEAFVQIAQTQLDDPVTHDRLALLWSELQGGRP
jgi:hypothetical protein